MIKTATPIEAKYRFLESTTKITFGCSGARKKIKELSIAHPKPNNIIFFLLENIMIKKAIHKKCFVSILFLRLNKPITKNSGNSPIVISLKRRDTPRTINDQIKYL